MNCADIRKSIFEESADLDAINNHLQACETCRKEFETDVKLEIALRGLKSEPGAVDISRDIYALIGSSKSTQSKFILRKRVIWAVAGALSIILFIIGLPNVISWGKELVTLIDSLPTASKNLDIRQVQSWAQSIRTVENIKIAMFVIGSVLLALSAYLWREFKQIVR